MRINLKNNPTKFHPDQIWNDGVLSFFEEIAPTRRIQDELRYEISSCS